MDLADKIRAYCGGLAEDEHHRYRSWEHCYSYFRSVSTELRSDKDAAALQLGFYLASWGMYRGSSFLLQRAYTVHLNVVDRLGSPEFASLWIHDIRGDSTDWDLIPVILKVVQAIRVAYRPYGNPTDTLVTKVLLGTLGCLPATDRFFVDGFKEAGFSYSAVNRSFVDRVMGFCTAHSEELTSEQLHIERSRGVRYPLMKLVDMYFWQIGYEKWEASRAELLN